MEISQKKLNETKTDIHTAWMLLKILKVCNFYGTVRIFKSEYHSNTVALNFTAAHTHLVLKIRNGIPTKN